MKNKLFIILSIVLATIFIAGCFSESNAAISVGKNMKTSLNQLSSTVRKLDTIDNNYIREYNTTNSINTFPTQRRDPKAQALADNNDINQLLEEELISRLICNEDGKCVICNNDFICNEDNICNSCNTTVNCDQYGNCNYCKDQLVLNGQNCKTCNKKVVRPIRNTSFNNNITDRLKQISYNNQNLQSNNNESNKINNTIENTHNTTLDNTNKTPVIDNNIIDKNSTTDTIVDDVVDNQNTTGYNLIIYTEESFAPEQLKYSPRYVSNYDANIANEHINRYLSKIQKFYAISTDVLEANNTLSNYKVSVLSNIDETNTLNNEIISGTYTPNEQQIIALNNYIADIKNTINNLKDCNGRLTKEINNITSSKSITNSIDVINSNYVTILNHIDTRISYHENALSTLEQIKFLITDVIENQNNNTIYNDSNTVLNNNSNGFNDNINNVIVNDDIIDTNNNYDNFNTTNKDVIVDNNHNQDVIIDDNNTDIIDEYDSRNTSNNYTQDLDNNLDNSTPSQNEENVTNNMYENNNSLLDNNSTNFDSNYNTQNIVDNTTNSTSNIDTNNSVTNTTNMSDYNGKNLVDNSIINNDTTDTTLIDTYDDNIYGNNIDTYLLDRNHLDSVSTPNNTTATDTHITNNRYTENETVIPHNLIDSTNDIIHGTL